MAQATYRAFPWSVVDTVHDAGQGAITLLLVDDQPQVLQGLSMLLALEPDLRVLGTAHTAEAGIALARQLRPDIIVMDVQLPGIDGISATRQLGSELPRSKVIILTLYGDADTRRRAMLAGASAFVVKHDLHGALLAAIRQTAGRHPG
jgi:DNA-binding NarL/FixJ family response regulator